MSSAISTRYVRNSSGEVVHSSSCSRLGAKVYQWNWAEGLSDAAVLSACIEYRIRRCRVCDPLGEAS